MYLWSKEEGKFGKELPESEVPITDGTSVTGSRKRQVARWKNFIGPIPTGGSLQSRGPDSQDEQPKYSKANSTYYPKKFPPCPIHHSIFNSSSFTKPIHCEARPGFTNEAIPHYKAQTFPHGHLASITPCGQFQQKKRVLIAFAIPGCSNISNKRKLACLGHQRRSQNGKQMPRFCGQVVYKN
ncbi:hypothetical protein O181_052591 [Austropuccinia psidii MF-1]|uniref:Uncharacterized protein n=1 Tax=Austropuccinia psidii MF-1 TaxID=1389203 RepID=A0A9Q3HPE3_9BASI|nr:hypothetical protein [Austropuccinia psidii MF-1]